MEKSVTGKKHKVCALILNYNTSDDCIELFRSLNSFHYSYLEVLILDNGSKPEETLLLERNIPNQNLLLNKKNLGYAGGNNIGLRSAIKEDYNYVWVLNPDIRVERETLPRLLEVAGKLEKIAAVGTRILRRENPNIIFSDGGEIIYDMGCTVRHKNFNRTVKSNYARINFDIDYIDGSCILISSNAIKELGYFSEDYFLYFEETDWCVNAKKKGWKLAVNSDARAYNRDSKKAGVYFYYLFRNKMIFAKKYHPRPGLVRIHLLFTLAKQFFLHIFKIRRYWYWKDRVKGFLEGQKWTI